jgi:hypothetical protein
MQRKVLCISATQAINYSFNNPYTLARNRKSLGTYLNSFKVSYFLKGTINKYIPIVY